MDCSWPKWPVILAEMLNMEPINLCKSGMGQEYIYSSLSDEIQERHADTIGHVIAAWSTAPRRDWEKTENWLDPQSKDQTFFRRWHNDRTDAKGDVRYWTCKSIRYQYAFQNLMEQSNIPYNHVQMISLIKGHIWEIMNGIDYSALSETDMYLRSNKLAEFDNLRNQNINLLRDSLMSGFLNTIKKSKYKFNDKFLGWPTDEKLGGFSIEYLLEEKHKISKLDRHPNKIGQERIAELIYDRME
jgi:hypothetical protein